MLTAERCLLLVPRNDAEVDAVQVERSRILLHEIPDIERSITKFPTDILREVQRAVDVEIEVMGLVFLGDDIRNRYPRELAGDRHVRNEVVSRDAAQRRDGCPR